MDFETTFIYAEPEVAWIEDFIFQILKDIPVELFGETNPWDSILTLCPFIHEFDVVHAKDTTSKVRKRMAVSKETMFPKDHRDSEINFKEFIDRKPLCIMITGDLKPSFFQIGQEMCKHFGTYYITPVELIRQQILRQTQIGKWLHWNLKEKKGIPIWIVMKLLEAELESSIYSDKGYILTGFPIIPEPNTSSDTFSTLIDYQNSEERYFEVPSIESLLDEDFNCNEEEADFLRSSSSSSSMHSDVWSKENISTFALNTEFLHLDIEEHSVLNECIRKQLDIINHLSCRPDYLVYLDTYLYTNKFSAIIETLQEFFLLYFRENALRIDFRIGTVAVCDCLRNRFKYKNYKINYECINVNTNGRPDMTLEELCDMEKILPNRKWWISKFGRICPVSLYYGRRRFCDSKFPVRYLRYIFLFYSSRERRAFVSNPRKYMNLQPTCRAAVIGPHRTGKSTLSQFIAQHFKADIYKNHVDQTAHHNNKNTVNDVEKELKHLEKLAEDPMLKRRKVKEWTECVLAEVNDILTTALDIRNIFSNKEAEKYFDVTFESSLDATELKFLILENIIFNKCIQNITSSDFLEWVSMQQTNHLHRQYVIDSAPLDIGFWQELLANDELPDCIYFLNPSTVEKMFDLHSLVHNENCINDGLIFENLCQYFGEWKQRFGVFTRKHIQTIKIDKSTLKYHKHLVAKRYKEATEFVKQYTELKSFLLKHDVVCIDIDISKQSWTQSILQALIDSMSVFRSKANALYAASVDSKNEEDVVTNVENEEQAVQNPSENNLSLTVLSDYGNCLDWCPVKLKSNNILLKGEMRYAASYRNKMYVMHSRQALSEFLANPQHYLLNEPIVPPARVFCLGVTHTSKAKFANNLASHLNVESISYAKHLKFIPFTTIWEEDFSIEVMKTGYNKIKQTFLQELTHEYEKGAVISGFPLLLEQFNEAIACNIYPECVLIFDEQQDVYNEIQRYFTKPNQNVRVSVPDERFDFLCDYHKPVSKVPAYLNVVDIAGLVKGAADGQGLGNEFLSHISACDAIFHLCRAFEDPDVTHVEGEVDPVRDLDIIAEELRLKDEEKLIQNLDKLEKVVARGGDKKLKPEYDSLLKVKAVLMDEKKHLRFADWNAHDIETLNKYLFLTTKPAIYLINLSDKDFIRKKNKWLAKIKEWVDKHDPGATIIPFSGHFEHDLAEKEESERKAYEDETKCKSVLDKIIVTGYKALQLEYFFTAGPDEVKAWTIQKGTKAPQAAGRIHTDFEKGFIMAEVMHFKDFKEEGSEAAAKSAGKYRQQGRNYVVEDGDIIFFKFNAGAGLKDAKKK